MTPVVYLNPPPSPFPLVDDQLQVEEPNLQLFLSPSPPPSSLNYSHVPTNVFNTTPPHHHQDQRLLTTPADHEDYSEPHDHKVNKFMASTHEGSISDHQQASSSSSSLQSAANNGGSSHNLSFSRSIEDIGDHESGSDNVSSVKWMSSKMRIMKKMMNNSNSNSINGANNNHDQPLKFHYPIHERDNETNSLSKTNNYTSTTTSAVRVCSDCNTTTTPLWRSGPRGPKSLCNACGIRQRKARRAMEAAAAAGAAANGGAAAVATDGNGMISSMKIKVTINKEKKPRTSHGVQYKKQFSPNHHHQSQKKLCFKDFALSLSKNSALQRVFPQDVEDAAILLMELSCGLVHS